MLQAAEQRHPVAVHPRRAFQRTLQLIALCRGQRLGGEGMPDLAAESRHAILHHLIEHAAAARAGHRAGVAGRHVGSRRCRLLRRDPRLGQQPRRHGPRRAGGLAHQAHQQRRQVGQGRDMRLPVMPQRIARHLRPRGVFRVLHHADPAAAADRQQPRGAVVQHAGQHHAHDARPIGDGDRTEQRVDRGPGPVLIWSAPQQDAIALDQHVTIGRSNGDRSRRYRFTVFRMMRRQRSSAAQQLRQHAARRRADVLHDQDRGGQASRQARAEAGQRLHPSGRTADRDDIVAAQYCLPRHLPQGIVMPDYAYVYSLFLTAMRQAIPRGV